MSMTETYKKIYVIIPALTIDTLTLSLKRIPCFYKLMQFKKDQAKIRALLDFGSKVNIMTLVYVAKLDLKV